MSRRVVWFSCGAASAVAAKVTTEAHNDAHIVYCDTSASEHSDNLRFFGDVEKWIGRKIEVIRSTKYISVDDVFEGSSYMSGIAGAKCTTEMKKIPRRNFEQIGDIHIFGFTADEPKRIVDFEARNPELLLEWPLAEQGFTKQDCYRRLMEAEIALPVMYLLGYRNNNCLGCVKATSPGYWSKVKRDFPETFARRAEQSRAIGCRLVRVRGVRMFLDEMPEEDFTYENENISCGPECGSPAVTS